MHTEICRDIHLVYQILLKLAVCGTVCFFREIFKGKSDCGGCATHNVWSEYGEYVYTAALFIR